MHLSARDRRSSGRVLYTGKVTVHGAAALCHKGSSRDFTEEGARLVVPGGEVSTGSSIVLHLKVEAQRFLSLLATVVWTKPDPQGKGTELGVRFAEGCHTSRRQLANWLHRRRLLGAACLA